MSRTETQIEQHEEFFDLLKENYAKRVDEMDAFSRRLSNACIDVSTEFLYGCLNIMQHYLDLQKRYSNQFPAWYFADFTEKMVRQNTEVWIQAVQNFDSVCIEGMKNMKNNLRALNKSSILCIQSIERAYDVYENVDPNHKIQPKLEPPKNQAESKANKKESTQVEKEVL